jgi:hypothetical protein
MLKMLGVGFVLLFMVLVIFSAVHSDQPPRATTKLEPVDMALVGCERWTTQNSKIAVAKIDNEYVITGVKLPAKHYLVGLDYRAGSDGLLMKARCEYAGDENALLLVKASAGLK